MSVRLLKYAWDLPVGAFKNIFIQYNLYCNNSKLLQALLA